MSEAAGRPPSPLRAALRLGLHGLRARGRREPGETAVPRRRVAVERQAIPIDPARVRAYLAVIGGRAAVPRDDPGAVVPPTFSALWETALALELLLQAGGPLPTGGLVHLESELVQLRPLRPGDRVRCRLELDRAEPHPRGVRLTVASRNWNAQGYLCLQGSFTLLLRTRTPPPGAGDAPRSPRAEATDVPPAAWRELARWSLRANQGRRYARVSGDFNPIHLWGWSARLLGYPRPILHGYCTEAMVAHALVDRLMGGDPSALRRLRIAFRAPLALPAEVTLLLGEGTPTGKRLFRLVGEGARRPFAEGEFVGGE